MSTYNNTYKKIFAWLVTVVVTLVTLSSGLGEVNVEADSEVTRYLEYGESPADNPLRGFASYRGVGYYSDFPLSLEYITMPLSDIVIGENKYDWSVLEAYLDEIASYGNQSIVSFYMDMPGSDIGKGAIPTYLLQEGLKTFEYSGNYRTGYSPDYSDQRLWDMIYNFVEALGEKYDGDPRIAQIEASIVGIWAEWHTHPYSFGLTDSDLFKLAQTYDLSFNTTQISCRYPLNGTNELHVGYSDYSFCKETIEVDWSQLNRLKDENAENYWKYNMGGGEVFPELVDSIFKNDQLHVSGFESYEDCVDALHPSWLLVGSVNQFTTDEIFNAIDASKMLGYDFTVTDATFMDNLSSSREDMNLSLTMKNIGTAPFYYNWEVQVGIMNEEGDFLNQYTTDWDISQLEAKGESVEFTGKMTNLNLDKGLYHVGIRVVNPMEGGHDVWFANQSQLENGWLDLGTFTVDHYVAENKVEANTLPSAFDKYGLDVTAVDLEPVGLSSASSQFIGMKIRNYKSYSYWGTEPVVIKIYKDHKLYKSIRTDWNLTKIPGYDKRYYAWYLKGLEKGSYSINVQLTDNTEEIHVGNLDIVDKIVNEPQAELPMLLPINENNSTLLSSYAENISVSEEYTVNQMTAGERVGIKVRFYNNNIKSYDGKETIKLVVSKNGEEISRSTTDWNINAIPPQSTKFFMYYIGIDQPGTYEVSAMLDNDKLLKIDEITVLPVEGAISELQTYQENLEVVNYEIPSEADVDEDLVIGVRFKNNNDYTYTGDEAIQLVTLDGDSVLSVSDTDWYINSISSGSTMYYSWGTTFHHDGIYTIAVKYEDNSELTKIADIKVGNPTSVINDSSNLGDSSSKTYYDGLSVEKTYFEEEVVVGDRKPIGIRFANANDQAFTDSEYIKIHLLKDGKVINTSNTNWDIKSITPGSTKYFAWWKTFDVEGTIEVFVEYGDSGIQEKAGEIRVLPSLGSIDQYLVSIGAKDVYVDNYVNVNERQLLGVRFNNDNSNVYDGDETFTLEFVKDGSVAKTSNTNWSLAAIGPASTKYFAWGISLKQAGKYDVYASIGDTRLYITTINVY